MKLTAPIKLQPTPAQADALQRTLETINAACDYISQVAWERQIFRQSVLQALVAADVRATFGLSSHVTARCIAKVAAAYKLSKKALRTFSRLSAITFGDRSLSFQLDASLVTIWTLYGRQRIAFVCGDYQRELIERHCGQSELAYRNGIWFLFVTCDVATPQSIDIDVGVAA